MSKSVLKPDVTNENREKVREAGVKDWTDCSILPKISAISIRFFFFFGSSSVRIIVIIIGVIVIIIGVISGTADLNDEITVTAAGRNFPSGGY